MDGERDADCDDLYQRKVKGLSMIDLLQKYWPHLASGGTILTIVWAFFFTGFKDWLKQTFWDKVFKPKEVEQAQQPVTKAVFDEHKAGEEQSLRTIMFALDQNSRIIQDAAIQVADKAKEMRESEKLMQLARDEDRRVFDAKIGELHDKINGTNQTVAGMTGKLDVVIELAKNNLAKGA